MIDNFSKLNIGALIKLSALPEDMDPSDRQVAVLAILSGQTPDEIERLPIQEYMRRVVSSSFLDEDLPVRIPQRSYSVGGFELVPVRDKRKVLTAQFTDFKKYTEMAGADSVRLFTLTPELLSCMMVPRGHLYCDDYDVLDVQTAIRDELRADDAVALSAFFLALWMKSSRRILRYSQRTARRKKMKATLAKIADLRKMRHRLTTSRPVGDG